MLLSKNYGVTVYGITISIFMNTKFKAVNRIMVEIFLNNCGQRKTEICFKSGSRESNTLTHTHANVTNEEIMMSRHDDDDSDDDK